MKILKVGLTGGIVSGKTTVAKIMEGLGGEIIDADEIGHQIIKSNKKAWRGIVHYFGRSILLENNEINRKKLAQIVFSDKKKLSLLNKITHPEIISEIKQRIDRIKKNADNNVICIIDAPLLFEAKIDKLMDRIIVVYISREKQIKRLFIRDGLKREDAIKRIDSQMPLEEKVRLADYIIDNRFPIEEVRPQVIQIWEKLSQCLNK